MALKKAVGVEEGLGFLDVFILINVIDQKVKSICRKSLLRFLLMLARQLECDDQITSIGLPVELVFDGVETRVLPCMVLAIALESLIARLERLLREKAERKR